MEETPPADGAAFEALDKKFDAFSKDVTDMLGVILEGFEKHDKALVNLQKTVKSKEFSKTPKGERKSIKEEGEDSFEAKVANQREARKNQEK